MAFVNIQNAFYNIKNNQGFWKEFILHYHHLQEFFHLPLEYVLLADTVS